MLIIEHTLTFTEEGVNRLLFFRQKHIKTAKKDWEKNHIKKHKILIIC